MCATPPVNRLLVSLTMVTGIRTFFSMRTKGVHVPETSTSRAPEKNGTTPLERRTSSM